MMAPYFKTMIGKKINHSITTGDTFFTEVYKRMYIIEVLAVNHGKLTVQVNSYDIVPAGLKKSGTDKHFGEITIAIGNKSKFEIIDEIITNMDPNFILKYNIKLA